MLWLCFLIHLWLTVDLINAFSKEKNSLTYRYYLNSPPKGELMNSF